RDRAERGGGEAHRRDRGRRAARPGGAGGGARSARAPDGDRHPRRRGLFRAHARRTLQPAGVRGGGGGPDRGRRQLPGRGGGGAGGGAPAARGGAARLRQRGAGGAGVRGNRRAAAAGAGGGVPGRAGRRGRLSGSRGAGCLGCPAGRAARGARPAPPARAQYAWGAPEPTVGRAASAAPLGGSWPRPSRNSVRLRAAPALTIPTSEQSGLKLKPWLQRRSASAGVAGWIPATSPWAVATSTTRCTRATWRGSWTSSAGGRPSERARSAGPMKKPS